jgi:hypothetical protein
MWGPWPSLGEKGSIASESKLASGSFGPWGSVPVLGDAKRVKLHVRKGSQASGSKGSLGEEGSQASGSKRASESFGPWGSAPMLGDAKRVKLGPAFGPWSRPSSSKVAQKRAAVDFELACVLDTPAALRGQAKPTIRAQRAQDTKHIRIPEWKNVCLLAPTLTSQGAPEGK